MKRRPLEGVIDYQACFCYRGGPDKPCSSIGSGPALRDLGEPSQATLQHRYNYMYENAGFYC